MKDLLSDILAIVKASGALRANVETEGLKVSVEFPVEGPAELDLRAQDDRVLLPRPRFKVG